MKYVTCTFLKYVADTDFVSLTYPIDVAIVFFVFFPLDPNMISVLFKSLIKNSGHKVLKKIF